MPVVSSFCASRLSSRRDATRRMSATSYTAAAAQQQLRAPLQQHNNLALKWKWPSRPQQLANAGHTSRRDASCCCCAAQHQLRRSSSSRRRQWSHDDEWSRGLFSERVTGYRPSGLSFTHSNALLKRPGCHQPCPVVCFLLLNELVG